jgi:hypothetical protein
MLRYNGGTSVANIQVQGTRTRLMFKIMILGKNPPGPKGDKTQKQIVTSWRIIYANTVNKTHNGKVLRCKFNEPREGKIGGFSYLESLKKHKRRLHWGTFFEDSLFGSKKG